MLCGRPTKYCGGIEVYGDSADLRELYEVTSDLIEETNKRGSTGKLRFKRLPQLLRQLSWQSDAYRAFEARVEVIAKEQSKLRAQIDFAYPWTDVKM
jgi:hypothetical protein